MRVHAVGRFAFVAVLLCGVPAVAQDTTPPAAFDLVSPANGAWASATPTLDWAASSDGGGLARYDLYVDGALHHGSVSASSSMYALAAGEALIEGWHTWYVMAVDNVGNTRQSTSTWSVHVDATPPATFDLVGPTDGTWQNDSFTFSWNATADAGAGLAYYRLILDGSAGCSATGTSMSFEWVASCRSVADGEHAWAVEAVDAVGNRTPSPTWVVRLDRTAPTAPMLENPVDGFCGDDRTPLLTWAEASDAGSGIESYEVCLGVATQNSNADFTLGSTSTGPNGWSQLVTGSDRWVSTRNGRSGVASAHPQSTTVPSALSQSVTLPLACTSLEASIGIACGHPTNCSHDAYADIMITDTITSDTHILWGTSLLRECDGWRDLVFDLTPWAGRTITIALHGSAGGPGGNWSWEWVFADYIRVVGADASFATEAVETEFQVPEENALSDGRWSWNVLAHDAVGYGSVSSKRAFTVDATAPAAFDLASPADGSCTAIPTPSLCWNRTTDGGCGVGEYELWINGALATDDIPATSSCATAPTPLAEGIYTWSVSVEDVIGNRRDASTPRTLIVDSAPPAAYALSTPDDGSTVDTTTPTFLWEGSSDAGGLDHYELWIDGARNRADIAGDATSAQPAAPLSVGAHTWFVKAVDRCGGVVSSSGSPRSITTRECTPGVEEACTGDAEGECDPGRRTCGATGTWDACVNVISPDDEVCDTLDNDCDGDTDEEFGVGDACGVGACTGGTIVCADDGTAACTTMPGGLADASAPERCDDVDQDCDGDPTNGFQVGDSCGVGECAGGALECLPDGSGTRCATMPGGSADASSSEICDSEDNDCDGATDEAFGLGDPCGFGVCEGGAVECDGSGGTRCATMPGGSSDRSESEVCDTLDNDCDGDTDEDFDLGATCGVGACAGGVVKCDDLGGTQCSTMSGGSADRAIEEHCNGLDDDCDGAADEDFLAMLGLSCVHGLGTCAREGSTVCADDGDGVACDAVPGTPTDEVCDGVDNDCNGTVDVDTEGYGAPCDNGQAGACSRAGAMVCPRGGGSLACDAPSGMASAGTERCDGVDNDCDGDTDEGCEADDDDAAADDGAGDDDLVGDDAVAGDDDVDGDDAVPSDDDTDLDDDAAGDSDGDESVGDDVSGDDAAEGDDVGDDTSAAGDDDAADGDDVASDDDSGGDDPAGGDDGGPGTGGAGDGDDAAGGPPVDDGQNIGGCACDAAPGAPPAWLTLLLVGHRRRRSSRSGAEA